MINATSFGDLAQSFSLQRRGAALKTEMARLNEELTSGQVSDVKSVLAGNTSYLAGIENDLRVLDGYRVAGAEAGQFADAMQLALDRIQTASSNYSQDLLVTAQNASGQVLDQFAEDARSELETIVSALNTTVGGRTVFAGTATNQNPLADVDTILTGLQTALTGATSVDDVMAMTDVWFADPAGFAATAYQGSDTSLAPFRLGEGETVALSTTANDAALREVIKVVALAGMADDGSLSLSSDQKRELLSRAATDLLSAQTDLTAIRASVGASQERISQIESRNSAERTSLEFAKGALLGADPYETATKLEEVQFQLQALYTVTARMSDLSLVNFIR